MLFVLFVRYDDGGGAAEQEGFFVAKGCKQFLSVSTQLGPHQHDGNGRGVLRFTYHVVQTHRPLQLHLRRSIEDKQEMNRKNRSSVLLMILIAPVPRRRIGPLS